MIKVTLGEVKPQEVKPFPKLMETKSGSIVEVHENKDSGGYIGIYRSGPCKDQVSMSFNLNGSTDYNEPITLQNA